LTSASLALHVGGDFCWCGSPPLWAMVCRAKLRACSTPIAHGMGSYKIAVSCLLFKTGRCQVFASAFGQLFDVVNLTLTLTRVKIHCQDLFRP
jgi:hypothetical protein